jgi:DNA polymerase-3 subunit chi
MARIDFAFGASEKLSQACQTTLRQYLAGQKMVVFCSDAARLKAFDLQLWAVDDAAFVPHVMATDPLAGQTPVIMASENLEQVLAQAPAEAWLLNLDEQCPPTVGKLARVLEIVSDAEEDKASARARWRVYQAAGHDLRSHRLS